MATGYYDIPNFLNISGENLEKVKHYYKEAHPYYGMDVVVIGGKNSAAVSALDLYRAGARVTLVHRGKNLSQSIKYWIKPDIENRIKAKEISAFFSTNVIEISPKVIVLSNQTGKTWSINNDFVFAMTGYRPDLEFFKSLGISLSSKGQRPLISKDTYESNVPGIYLAGVVVGGMMTNEVFIENGRFHGQVVIGDIQKKLNQK